MAADRLYTALRAPVSTPELVLRLFLQLAVILGACRVVAALGRRVGQGDAVSEMVAGILLGPSLFGVVAPAAQAWLFPTAPLLLASGAMIPNPSMSILAAISQVGLALYMFLVGAELDLDLLKARAKSAGLVSFSGIVAPFVLGAAASVWLYDRAPLFAPGISRNVAALFLGVSLCITAFPVLARILHERGLAKTRLGVLTLAAGAIDDVVAWCLLAIVLATTKGSPKIAVIAIGGAALYVVAAVFGLRRFLGRWTADAERTGEMSRGAFVLMLLLLAACAWLTDALGVHAVFGAFVLGAVTPRGVLTRSLRAQCEPLTTTLFLPVFFVYSGLSTSIRLVASPYLLVLTVVLLALAVAGKGLACTAAARASGETWRDAMAVGTLMNARGLMELIILNIGLEQGIITPTLFTMLVVMALVTTFAASPLVARLMNKPAATTARAAAKA